MKSYFILRLFIMFFLTHTAIIFSQNVWKNIGPGGGSDLHFMAIPPNDDNTIYVGGDIEGIFKSTDFGQSWKNINNNLAHSNIGGAQYWINDIKFDPGNQEHVYICTAVGLYKSENGGDEWELLYPEEIIDEDSPVTTSSVAINPDNNSIIYLGLGNSADGTFADFEEFSEYGEATGLFKSNDRGTSWEEIAEGLFDGASIHSIEINALNTSEIIIAATNGLFRSNDGGSNWSENSSGLPHSNIHRLASNVYDGEFHLWATVKVLGTPGNASSFSGGIFKRSSNGQSWEDITSNLPRYDSEEMLFYDYWKVALNPETPDIIYTNTVRGSGFEEPGIYVTEDGGTNWELIHMQHEVGWLNSEWFWEPYAFDIKVASGNPNHLAACYDWVETSTDGGVSWTQNYTSQSGEAWKGAGLELMNTDCIAFHPENSDIFWIGYDDMGLFRTDDGGTSYKRLDPAQDPEIGDLTDIDGIKGIFVDPDNYDLYVSRWQGSQSGFNSGYTAGGIVYSSDLGETFSEISSGLPRGRCDLALDQSSGSAGNRVLYSAVYNHGVYKSTNSGQSWNPINNGIESVKEKVWEISISVSNPQLLYLGLISRGEGGSNLYKSEDAGNNWAVVGGIPEGDVISILIGSGEELYAGITDNFDWNFEGGLYRSTDDGDTWELINNHPRIIDVHEHPGYAGLLIAAGQPFYKPDSFGGKLYLSTDGGDTWDDITEGVNHTFFNFVQFNPHYSKKIYACSAGGGVWMLDDESTDLSNDNNLPGHFVLRQNYPNPFNPSTEIVYNIPEAGEAVLSVYNTLGQLVGILKSGYHIAGEHKASFNARSLPGGVYYYRLIWNNQSLSGKAVLIK